MPQDNVPIRQSISVREMPRDTVAYRRPGFGSAPLPAAAPRPASPSAFENVLRQFGKKQELKERDGENKLEAHEAETPEGEPQAVEPRGRDDGNRQAREDRTRQKQREPERSRDNVREKGREEGGAARARTAERKVVARQELGRHSGEGKRDAKGQGGGSGPGGGFGRPTKQAARLAAEGSAGGKRGMNGVGVEKENSPFAAQLLARQKAAAAEDLARTREASPVLNKAVLDQIVQYVRILIRRDGSREMELALGDRIFRGLQLRVAVIDGKVEATFVTAHPDTEQLFLSQKTALTQALEEKGMAVRGITITRI